ncbi:hypothetical protein B0A48_01945 [Cryoendolithus antarcticus]|uniref:SH3 domain-containing protein n=1 Tax=Cryoendolithus antarcticus TaxID=1507870 RepID=A0A1V8TQV3_9PEZI|nr:hypothetical protein B0A48_01945 [Cryoendolithus antarcticus]
MGLKHIRGLSVRVHYSAVKMKKVQRQFGKFTKRSEDQADVSMVLAEFKGADEMLERLAKDLKKFKEGWEDVLKFQYDASEAFATLYKPIEADDTTVDLRHKPTPTPQKYMVKCLGMQMTYAELRTELQQEIMMIDSKLIKPAEEAKQQLKPLKRTIKHRENMKLDYERYTGRTEHVRKKETRSVKEEQILAKHENDMHQAHIDYQTADEQVKETFPPITAAVVGMLPMLLATQIRIQTTLVGQLYTVLDEYTRKHGLPNPAPTDSEIVAKWKSEFTGLRMELEDGISTIAHGAAVKRSMNLPPEKASTTGLGIRGRFDDLKNKKKPTDGASNGASPSNGQQLTRRESGTSPQHYEEEEEAPPQPPRPRPGRISSSNFPTPDLSSKARIPSVSSSSAAPPPYPSDYSPRPSPKLDYQVTTPRYPTTPNPWSEGPASGGATPPSTYATPRNGVATPFTQLNNPPDYFASRRLSLASLTSATSAASLAAKKKAPPPVPIKRIMSGRQETWVVAVFDFEAQGAGDLGFREGERISVIKRTGSVDDWWEGELNGVTGSFPANYVKFEV